MIVVVGGTGLLGSELKRVKNELVCLGSDFDIFDFTELENKLIELNPDTIVNCAAIKSLAVDSNPLKSIDVNIIGSCNLAKFCIKYNKRLVYISTDYVYEGLVGNYKETDPIFPFNNYAWTKLSGEGPVKLVKEHLIIRTSFGPTELTYEFAYDNLFSSKDYVDIIAPMILEAIYSDITGILNIGTDKKSLYEFANLRNNIPPTKLEKSKDFSLNLNKYKNFFK